MGLVRLKIRGVLLLAAILSPSVVLGQQSGGDLTYRNTEDGMVRLAPELIGSAPNGSSGNSSPHTLGVSTPLYDGVDSATDAQQHDTDTQFARLVGSDEPWSWQILPSGLMYKSYLAGNREPRLGGQLVYERKEGWLLDATLGGRVGVLRYGTNNDFWPQGWQVDIEGAAFPRLDQDRDLVGTDFRAGVPLTTRQGPWEMKVGYYHYCSHVGDLYLMAHSDFQRINYVRDSIIWGVAVHLNPDVRLYSEASWAFRADNGAEPWEFQFAPSTARPFRPASAARHSSPPTAISIKKTILGAT